MVAYGAPLYHYGGTGNDALYEDEQAMWNKYGSQGVQPTFVQPSLNTAVGEANNYQQQSAQSEADALGLMRSQAMGGDTPAQRQARATLAYANNAQRAMASNAGGGQALAAARTAGANNTALQGANTANAMGALQAQEQATGRTQFGAMSNAMRKNEQDLYGVNSTAAYAAAENQAKINAANDQLMLGYSGMQNNAIDQQRQIQMKQGQFNLQNSAQNTANAYKGFSTALGGMEGAAQGMGNMDWGGSGGGGGDNGYSYPSYDQNQWDANNSDERLKTNIQHERGSLMRPFLDTLAQSRAQYEYNDPHDEPRAVPTGGRYAGVMAQDLERVPHLGHQLVIDTPHGKMIDNKTSLSALLAGVGDLHERVRHLEGHRDYDDG